MAMATREHKRNLHGAFLTTNNILFFEALLAANSSKKSTMMSAGRSASISVASDAMVCVECFRMKDDQDLKVPCQNPRCYFYLRVPAGCVDGRDTAVSPGPIFNKEVGCDRSLPAGRTCRPRPSQSSDYLLSQRSLSQEPHSGGKNGSIWAFKPLKPERMGNSPGRMTQQHTADKTRSQSVSMGSGHNAALLMRRLQSHREEADAERAMRNKRLLSMPLTPGMEAALLDGVESDLVEDAFLSSPLPEFATMTTERPLNPGAVGQKMVSWCMHMGHTHTDIEHWLGEGQRQS